jgi:ABC-type multidrug transport system ATPase subunit
MQVRLAFSMATRSEADILLVDEVLAVGDADFQRKCFNYFKELKAKHKTVVFVTHDMGAVREYCDRAMMIEQSQMVHIGSADEIATEYVKLFNRPTTSGVKAVEGKDRWGDGIVQFDTIKTEVTDKEVVVEMDAKAQGESVDPVFGYLIKDSAGNDLIGSNTKINKVTIGTVHRGDRLTVRWHLPNIFNDGVFLLTAAISHNDGVTQHDWWNTAASFTVFREDKTPYALNPQANIEVERG